MRKYIIILTCFFNVILLSCSKDDAPGVAPIVISEKITLNATYGSDPEQTMDIYLPANRRTDSTKVLIIIHGGAWTFGDKTDMTAYIPDIRSRLPGYAIFNINYRLAVNGVNLFPTQENDVKSAIQYIHSKRSEYLISDKFVVLGASAGAHLALLHSYKYLQPVKIKAVIDFFGPTDLVDMYNNPASVYAPPSSVASVLGGTPSTAAALYASSSPVNYVTSQSAPTILLHGGADPLVRPAQSEMLRSLLTTAGVPNQYVYYPLLGHGWTGADLEDSYNRIQLFLNTHVQ